MDTRTETARDLGQKLETDFQAFIAMAPVKLFLSMIPPTDPPELLHTLLKMAFEAGNGSGIATIASVLLKDKPRS